MIIFTLIVLVGFTTINIINTKALSPIGNGEDNYNMVSEEFGDDFEEFIKDNAAIKIYTEDEDNENTTIKIQNKEVRIKKENPFIKGFSIITSKVKDTFSGIKNKFDGKIKENTDYENEVNTEVKDDKLNNIVDEFINTRENTNWENQNVNEDMLNSDNENKDLD